MNNNTGHRRVETVQATNLTTVPLNSEQCIQLPATFTLKTSTTMYTITPIEDGAMSGLIVSILVSTVHTDEMHILIWLDVMTMLLIRMKMAVMTIMSKKVLTITMRP